MLELEEALARILAAVPAAAKETVPLVEAYRRILAESVVSPLDLPPFDNSAMDGYAVRAADVSSARADAPVRLRVRGKVPAGQAFSGELGAGDCVRLFTGSPLPRGADAVVMQEDTRVEAASPDVVEILEASKPWESVRLQGEDVKRGSTLASAGEMVTARHQSLFGAVGLGQIAVARQPVVGLLATGSELREAGQTLAQGQIYESNRVGLSILARNAGAIPKVYPLVPDAAEATRLAIEKALAECNAVITSGGVSVGEMDFIKAAFEQAGVEIGFWKVSIKPGRPFAFGRCEGKLLFGLPGNPVSALVTFLLLVRPALLRWQGAADLSLPGHAGTLADSLSNPGERRHFMRVKVDAEGRVRSTGMQASHALGSLAAANALVDVPPRTVIPPGATVRVLRWE